MEHYKEITETKIINRQEYINTTCDICGKVYKEDSGNVPYIYNRVKIEHIKGESYPGNTSEKWLKLDICSECFEEKILPFLRSIGVKTEYEDTSF